jgi:hypothetical protein
MLQAQDKFAKLGAILHLDVEKTIRDSLRINDPDLKKRTRLIWSKLNFSNRQGHKEDYLVEVNYAAEWWKDKASLVLAFVRARDSFRLVFCWFGSYSDFGMRPKLVDIDSDSQLELLFNTTFSGHQSSTSDVSLYRFNGNSFTAIFSEDLLLSYASCPYSTDNRYRFVRNRRNPQLLDIHFTVSTDTLALDELIPEPDARQRAITVPKPFHETYIFQFDGNKYMPNKPVYDYRGFFREFYKGLMNFGGSGS